MYKYHKLTKIEAEYMPSIYKKPLLLSVRSEFLEKRKKGKGE